MKQGRASSCLCSHAVTCCLRVGSSESLAVFGASSTVILHLGCDRAGEVTALAVRVIENANDRIGKLFFDLRKVGDLFAPWVAVARAFEGLAQLAHFERDEFAFVAGYCAARFLDEFCSLFSEGIEVERPRGLLADEVKRQLFCGFGLRSEALVSGNVIDLRGDCVEHFRQMCGCCLVVIGRRRVVFGVSHGDCRVTCSR